MVTVQDLSQTYYGQKQAHKFSQVISDGIAETPDTTEVTVFRKRNNLVDGCSGTTIPSDNEAGYIKGCEFILTSAPNGVPMKFINVGDEDACEFKGAGSPYLVLVTDKYDLPDAEEGVITLSANTTYLITSAVDLEGDRLVGAANTALWGATPEISQISSTGLADETAIMTSTFTLALNNVAFDHATIFDLDATDNGVQVLDWTGVNLYNATLGVGTIKNYQNAIFNLIGFLNSGGMVFDGSVDTIAFSNTIFENADGLTAISVPATATITRRIRITDSAFVILAGETGINIDESATLPDEGYILRNCNFAGGGTYIAGIDYDSNKARWEGNRGIVNSGNIAQYFFTGNATATTINGAGTYEKVAGATSAGSFVEKFDVETVDNQALYEGALDGFYKVTAIATLTSGNNKVCALRIAKNDTPAASSTAKSTTNSGGRSEGIVCQDIVQLEAGDYLEVYVANETDTTDVTVEELNVIIERLN